MKYVRIKEYNFFRDKLEESYEKLDDELLKTTDTYFERGLVRIDDTAIDLAIDNLNVILKSIKKLKSQNADSIFIE